MTSPASARPEHRAANAAGPAAHRTITLITGDRVTVDAKGRVIGLHRAEGREQIPVQVRRMGGRTLVVPADASRLIASGKLDQRLFDITELNKSATRRSFKDGLKVIVGYQGAATAARADVREAGTLRRALKALNADAVQTPVKDTPELWEALTDGDRTSAGIAHIWLDGVRKVTLDKSVPQIGAPTAWQSGYTGKGVKIAVLDTGVDATHADLKSQVVAAKNFTTSNSTADRVGHGTHVASIAAGTGAKSGGKYKGVAPGAKILNGKVLDDEGYGDDSGILAGMEWAAQQGADIVNLSLGGEDTPGVDPLEAEVDKLSAEKGILFAIAAGNEGPESVGSPGSADSAITVGAVDKKNRLADFSSTGPRVGDGAIKPDVTAPGVAITAAAAKGSLIAKEVGESPAGYLTIDGTSMATPHVAGAAALLKQQHPDWGYAELKGALTGSAKGGPYTPFEQGAGRIAVDKAIKQTVIADPVSVSFGIQSWPHTDDEPVTKQLTYRNLGTEDVTLSLAMTATDPKGRPVPDGFFTLGATEVTVPAGDKASVDLTVNTRLGGTLDGGYSAYVTATGGGQSVRTAAAVQREVESYDVTVKHIGRDGKPTAAHDTILYGYTGRGAWRTYRVPDGAGTTTVRVPKGTYVLDAWIAKDLTTFKGGLDWLVQPKLSVTGNVTVTVDARKAKPADITVPDKTARQHGATIGYSYDPAMYDVAMPLGSWSQLRTGSIGGDVSGLSQVWSGQWTKGSSAEYDVVTTAKVKRFQGGKVRHYAARELATVKNSLGAGASGKTGAVTPLALTGDGLVMADTIEQKLPGTRTLYLSTGNGVYWFLYAEQFRGHDKQNQPISEALYTPDDVKAYKGGKTYTNTFNRAVFGPHLNHDYGVFRYRNELYGSLPLFADSGAHGGYSTFTLVQTTLYRNGKKVASNHDPLFGESFDVTAGDAQYRLTTSVKRSAKVAGASTRVDASWTFRSKKPSGSSEVRLPASTLRFKATTGLDNRVAAGRTATFPVTVEGAAAGKNLKSLSVWVSYNDGKTWKKVTVKKGKITVKNPAKGKAVSYKAKITDKKGNVSTVAIYGAYRGK
ncbi:S8 family serine peptidase [Streptomyces sp. NBC_01788]|uniref:S8 family peptidase n=1 Tax=Streptomyces sp. NBC_01788 TaxID=2975940 RepID=UPI002DD9A2C1|nr:S8 family serine peptidase [Streptomyces sp. NBC_01788]WSB31241.1 S8 family serine peptidase [Streptomyces sp. NBC_01788]